MNSHFAAGLVAFFAASSAACMSRESMERNPNFPQGARAPSPTVAYPVLDCGAVMSSVASATNVLYGQRVSTKRPMMSAAPEIEPLLCAFVKGNASGRQVTLISLAAGAGDSRWHVPAALTATVQKLQAESGGASGLFVVLHQETICSNRTSTMKDAQGRAIATVESSDVTCDKAPYVNVDALLFTSQGDLLWHGAEAVDPNSDDQIAGLFARIPADFADPPKGATIAAR
jgi:hypothetical protein